MLFVVFQLGGDHYAVEAAKVSAILPFVEVTRIQSAPREVAGLFNYRGGTIPAIDLSILLLGRPAPERFSTRIILVQSDGAGQDGGWLGLIAEHTTKILRLEPGDFRESGIASAGAPYLGPIARTPQGLVRHIDLAKLIAACGRFLHRSEMLDAS